jgi:hypothetical protein
MTTQTVAYEIEARRKTEAECVRRITPPALKDVSLLRIVERCVTLLPVLLVFSTLGCLVGHYFLGVALDRLGVAVSVPLVLGFLLVKWTMVAFPFNPEKAKEQEMPPLAFRFFGLVLISSTVLSASFLLSSPVYYLFRWVDLGGEALILAATGLIVAILALIGALVHVLRRHVLLSDLLALLIVALWKMAIVFLSPRLVSRRFHHGGGAPAGA